MTNFPKPETIHCRYINGKEKKTKGNVKLITPNGIHDRSSSMVAYPLVPLSEALGIMLSLPLPWEIVTADVSLRGNEGAWQSSRVGGWEIKNARCREIKTRAVGSRVMLLKERVENGICIWDPLTRSL